MYAPNESRAAVGQPSSPQSPGDRVRSRAGKTLLISRSAPPGVSGSAHVLDALLDYDAEGNLLAVGGRSPRAAAAGKYPNLQLLPTELSIFGRGARFVAPVKALLGGRAARSIARIASRTDVDRLVCVFPDAFYCAAALRAARMTGKPVDFWFHNTYAANRSGIAGVYARRLEARIMTAAERVFFISDALRQEFASRYPAAAPRFGVLRHPVAGVDSGARTARGFSEAIVRATLIGNINESNIDATGRMLRALAGHPRIRIRMCTPVPRMLLAARGLDLANVDFRGYLPEAELARLMDETDLFLLPHGLTGGYSPEEYRTIFPTRAAHYLAHGRPILVHCPRESGLFDFLQAHDCAVTVNAAEEAQVVAGFEGLLGDVDLQMRIARNALRASTLFDPSRILATLRSREA